MKWFLLLISLAILMPLTLLASGATTESSESVEAELKSFKSQVASLEKRVQTLGTQLADRSLRDLQLAIPQRPQIPKEWLKRQFNGIPILCDPSSAELEQIKSGKSYNLYLRANR